MRTHRKRLSRALGTTLITLSLGSGLAPSGRAQATPPSVPPPTDEAVVMEAYTVSGYRESLAASLDAKRKATATIDVITAEDVGKFPDTNIAESLSHIPGITVDRLFGQGERVSILGTDPKLNRTLLNGETIASADWFILDQPGRTFNYSLLAPEVIGQLEVYKTPEARIDEGSIGGTIILHTRDPLNLRPNTLSGSVSDLYNDRAKKGDFNGSVLYGWHNAAKTFGFVVAGQANKEHIRRDGLENFGEGDADAASNYASTDATVLAFPDATVLGSLNAAYFQQIRERTGGNVGVTWKPIDHLQLEYNGLYVKAKYNNSNQSFYINPDATNAEGFLSGYPTETLDHPIVANGFYDSVHIGNGYSEYDAAFRRAEVITRSNDFKATWQDEGWDASVHGGKTSATGGTQKENFAVFHYVGGYTYANATGDHPTFAYDDPKAASNASNWVTDPNNPSFSDAAPTSDKESYIQGDYDVKLPGALSKILLGVKHRDHQTTHLQYSATAAANGVASSFAPGLTPSNFLSGFPVSQDMKSHLVVGDGAIANWLSASGLNPSALNYQQTWNIEEKIDAAYLQGDFSFGDFSGNAGVRAVRTKSDSNGYNLDAAGNASPTSVDKKYNSFLPNVNLVYAAAHELTFRGSVAKVIARPDYADMTSYLSVSTSPNVGQGGNPQLDPYRATNYDVSADWYFAKNSVITAQLFYKDIQSYITKTVANETVFNTTTKTSATYQITRPHNASNARSQGFALAYQQAFASGFGATANYTYVDAVGNDPVNGRFALPYASRHQLNLSPYFENDQFSARLTYSWRSGYAQPGYFGAGVYNRAYTELDASIGYNVTKNVKVSLDALNLLDEEDYIYYQYPTSKVMAYAYREGRRLQAALHFTF